MEVAHGTDVNTTEDESEIRMEILRDQAATPEAEPEPEGLVRQDTTTETTVDAPEASEQVRKQACI